MDGISKKKNAIFIYLVIVNGFTWLCWIPGLLIGAKKGYIMPNFDNYANLFETGFINLEHILLGLFFALGVFGPLIGALVATYIEGGRAAISQLMKKTIDWKVGWRWYLTIFIIAFLLPAIPVVIFLISSMGELNIAGAYGLLYILFVFVALVFTSGLGEEPGWRGYLLPHLKARFDGEKYIWVLGLIWAIWHYPLVVIIMLNTMIDVSLVQIIITLFIGLLGQTMSLIGMTFIYVWLLNKTGSVFLAIIFHALTNLLNIWLLSFLLNQQMIIIFVAVMPWFVVIILKKKLGKENFPG